MKYIMYKLAKIVLYAILGMIWYKLETDRVRKADLVDGRRYVGYVERDGSDRA